MPENLAENSDPVSRPRSWEKAVKAATLRLLGASQTEAAKGADLGERTLRRYEQCSWWPEAEADARENYLGDVRSAAYKALLDLVQSDDETGPDPKTVRWTLERVGGEEFIPPKQRIEQEVSADVETTRNGPDLSNLTDEELDELERLRRKANGDTSDA